MSGDTRGQSVQIGAILLFAFLILGLALAQAVLVPQQNAEIEFTHNQKVQGQLQDVRTGLLRTAATGNAYPATVQLGVRYPDRFVLLNPAPASGTLRTVPRGDIVVRNAVPVNEETADHWTASGGTRTFRTVGLRYDPAYNVYERAPTTVYGSSVLYNRHDDRNRTLTDQSFVDGRKITLVALNGTFSESGTGTVTVDPRPASAVQRTVAVTNATTPVEVTVPIRLNNSEVRTLLAEQLDPSGTDPDAYVTDITCSNTGAETPCGLLTLTFELGATYDLRLGEVGLGTGTRSVAPAYLTDVRGDGVSIPEGGSTQLVVEVRDRYNNPVAGQHVTAQIKNSGNPPATFTDGSEPLTKGPTDADGRVTYRFEAPDEVNPTGTPKKQRTYTVLVGLGGGTCSNPGSADCVSFTVYVTEMDGDQT